MGLVLGLALLTGIGALCLAWLFVQEALRFWRRYRRKLSAWFYAVLAAACLAYFFAAMLVAANIMEFGGFFDLLPEGFI